MQSRELAIGAIAAALAIAAVSLAVFVLPGNGEVQETGSGLASTTPKSDLGHERLPATVNGAAEATSKVELEARTRLEQDNARLAADNEALRAEVGRLRAEVYSLKSSVATERPVPTPPVPTPPIPDRPRTLAVNFGRWGEIEQIANADWNLLGRASTAMADSLLPNLFERMMRGETMTREDGIAIARENQKLAVFTLGVNGQLPTHLTGNGEYSHPIVIANLIAKHLELASLPLSEAQILDITGLGSEYDTAWERRQASYAADSFDLERLYDELVLKKTFIDRIEAVLTAEQREAVFDPRIRHLAGFDIYSPVIMLTGAVATPTGKTDEELRAHLLSTAAGWGLERERLEALTGVFDAWMTQLGPALGAVSATGAPYYRLDEVLVAIPAELQAMVQIIQLLGPSPEIVEAIRDEGRILLPRRLQE